MKNVKVVGMWIPCIEEKNTLSIESYASLSEADLVVLHPHLSFKGANKSWLEVSGYIHKYIGHWDDEITLFLENGGTLVVVLGKDHEYHYQSLGYRVDVEHIKGSRLVECIEIAYSSLEGNVVYPKRSIYETIKNSLPEGGMTFQSELTEYPSDAEVSFTDRRGDKVLGVTMKEGKGIIMVLPYVSFEEYYQQDQQSGNSYNIGGANNDPFKTGQRFIEALSKAGKTLKKGNKKTPPPEWLNREAFDLSLANQIEISIKENKATIANLEKKNEALEVELEAAKNLQGLLFETGKPLEEAVTEALTLLGYQAENYDDGELELDQIITSPEGDRYIGECEGKDNKAINVSKFRQLKDSIAQDFELDHVEEQASGLLIGNPQRLLPPNERTEDFTQKCKTGAKRDGTGLIKTIDLFCVARYLKEHDDADFAKQCREAIKNQLGEVIEFPPIPAKA